MQTPPRCSYSGDILIGATGSTRLFGEGGANTFVFDAPGGVGNLTRSVDVVSGEDRIELVGSGFTGLGGEGQPSVESFGLGRTATTAEQNFLCDEASGDFLYDANGLGGAAADLVAQAADGRHRAQAQVLVASNESADEDPHGVRRFLDERIDGGPETYHVPRMFHCPSFQDTPDLTRLRGGVGW